MSSANEPPQGSGAVPFAVTLMPWCQAGAELVGENGLFFRKIPLLGFFS